MSEITIFDRSVTNDDLRHDIDILFDGKAPLMAIINGIQTAQRCIDLLRQATTVMTDPKEIEATCEYMETCRQCRRRVLDLLVAEIAKDS